MEFTQEVRKATDPIYQKISKIMPEIEWSVHAPYIHKINQLKKEKNAIIVASYGTFSTGINIRNLHNIVFASPSKSRVRALQSIGRGLRRSDTKDAATLFDLADDLSHKSKRNFTLNHFLERINIYNEEQFDYTINRIKIK